MSPPVSKDWWLAAALTTASVPVIGQTGAATPGRQIGVVTSAAAGGTQHAPLVVDGSREHRITTDGSGPVHVLLADQSALTIAPNSSVVIRQFEFDQAAKSGNIVLELTRGLLRVVGGQISKRSPTRVATPTATIGIRGGISIVEVTGEQTKAAFLFGESMEVNTIKTSAQGGTDDAELAAGMVAAADLDDAPGVGEVETAQTLSGDVNSTTVTRAGQLITVSANGLTLGRLTAAQLQTFNERLQALVSQVASSPTAPGTGPRNTVIRVDNINILVEVSSSPAPNIRDLAGTTQQGS